ncbi:MAG: hypothetical protein HKN82_14830 [Akkermansiaceae bacterium]|nr:hypothetical protein [Akkermansiaceae bacterium]
MARTLAVTDDELRKERAAALMTELTPQVWDGLTPGMVPGLLQLFEAAKDFGETWHKQEPFFRAWTRVSPAEAFAYVNDPENKFGKGAWGQSVVIGEWAKNDPAAAQQAVLALEGESDRYYMAHGLIGSLSTVDLDAAIAFSKEYEEVSGGQKRAGAGTLARRLLDERGVAGVQEWFDGIDFGEATSGYKREALEHLAYWRTGDGMAALLAAQENQSFLNSELLADIANSAAKGGNDEERAEGRLDWLAKLPAEVGPQRQAVGEQFERYLKQDSEAAGEWLLNQELGPAHDEAIGIFVRNATMDDVPAAMLWAEQISDPALRAEMIRFVRERGGK